MIRIQNEFKMRRLPYISSSANFITLVFEDEIQAEKFVEYFLKNGIILRHLNSFGLPECVRVTIGKDSEMGQFINKLDSVLEHI